jgi:hypothetical protein
MCVHMRLSSREANRPAPQETCRFAFYIREALVGAEDSSIKQETMESPVALAAVPKFFQFSQVHVFSSCADQTFRRVQTALTTEPSRPPGWPWRDSVLVSCLLAKGSKILSQKARSRCAIGRSRLCSCHSDSRFPPPQQGEGSTPKTARLLGILPSHTLPTCSPSLVVR